MTRIPALVLAGAVLAPSQPAAAQTPAQSPAASHQSEEIVRSMHLAARNQLGILQYCQAQGAVGEDVVALQRQALGALPPTAQVGGLEEAEAAGKRGMIAFDGSEVPFAVAAGARGLRVRTNCKYIALTVQAQAGQPPKW